MGASLYSMDASLAARYHLAVDQGALVTQVVNGGPSDNAGIKAGDVITDINGAPITDAPSCQRALQEYDVGITIQVTFYRSSSQKTVNLILCQSS